MKKIGLRISELFDHFAIRKGVFRMPYFNGVELTDESIKKTRKWFQDNASACIEEVKSGKVQVNDCESYFKWRNREAEEYMEGCHDHTLTFLQRAYFVQTGKSVPLLF